LALVALSVVEQRLDAVLAGADDVEGCLAGQTPSRILDAASASSA
jgi:hypothetical protein